jgi:hypothetical protein
MPHGRESEATRKAPRTAVSVTGPGPRRPSVFPAAWLCLAMGLVGCSARYADIADVRGVVTLDGKPLEAATVLFQPAEGRGSVGRTDAEGRYRLLYTPRALGARIGPCNVRISTTDDDDGRIGVDERVPRRYFEPGALAAEVAARSNVFDFHLTTKPGS